ncbi:von Willebrand factor A domain-containing protein 3A isoform X2 [Esox lucius]|uniref:VWFA domain-containing protein n=1 Tax=Esox lucius TaxID=8010 RepID=A0A3P8XJU8_ESOLU|nr:von Willebrand factor A domain-containing protein 3A isoform X2 [Esox lucius]
MRPHAHKYEMSTITLEIRNIEEARYRPSLLPPSTRKLNEAIYEHLEKLNCMNWDTEPVSHTYLRHLNVMSRSRSEGQNVLDHCKPRCVMDVSGSSPTDVCPSWEDVSLSGGHTESSELSAQRTQDQPTDRKSSSDWLMAHSLQSSGLSLSGLLSHVTTRISKAGEDGGLNRQLEISAAALTHFDFKLYQAIELYHGRIRWLNQGSMKVFGLVMGSRVGLMVDTSDGNCTKKRLPDLQRNLLSLVEEQLSCKRQLYLMSWGTETSSLWDGPRDVSRFRLQEVCGWVGELRPTGGCNLLQALKKGLDLGNNELDSLVIVMGSSPDETSDALFDFVQQRMLGRTLQVHVVSYCSNSPQTIGTVKRLAKVTQGRYHIYSASLGVADSSTDVEQLWAEIKAARGLLGDTVALRQGRLRDVAVTVMGQQVDSAELDSLSKSPSFLTPPPIHEAPLTIKPSGVLTVSSDDWLSKHGLKAKRLGLYQVLSPNAYSLLEGFVPILNKTVSSTIHEKAMVQFEWHDGTVKNIHVDIPTLYSYQRRLKAAVAELERRVLWLSSGSRRIWGSLCEQRVVIVADVSVMNSGFSVHIQHSLRVLLEEQLADKHSFNIIAFSSDARTWRERFTPPTPENLQEAWLWVQGLQYSGGRHTLAALRLALEGEIHGGTSPPSDPLTQGVYLFTSGVPDQEKTEVISYVSERCSSLPIRLHVCLFTGEEQTQGQTGGSLPCRATREEAAGVLREMARAGNGHFHWTSETGILESDDISALIGEMERAASYWQKSSMLVDSFTQRLGWMSPEERLYSGNKTLAHKPLVARLRKGQLPPPRPTALSLSRLQMKEGPANERSSSTKAFAWRPSSATAAISTAEPMTGLGRVETKFKQRKPSQVSHSVFYLEDGNIGMVFKSHPKPRSVRKSIPIVVLPKQEEICSTKQWLKKFSIKKQKLDLNKLMSGPECTHHRKLVPSVLKRVAARYCSIFPSVHINGALKHLQLTPGEMKQYLTQTERLLHCYTQRMAWLLSGSRRVFGVVLEKEVCVLIDVSGSMAPYLGDLKSKLASLIWDQLHHNTVRFSVLAFSGGVTVWRPALQEPTEEACGSAVQWVCQLDCHGGTNTLEALQTGCGFGDGVGLYLLSDGKPDSSCSLVLREAETLTAEKHITIHTVSYNCTDSSANDFLKNLAHKTGGRYHRCHNDDTGLISGQLASNLCDGDKPMVLAFQGDDLRRLSEEIDRLKHFRSQAHAFRQILLEKKNPEEA